MAVTWNPSDKAATVTLSGGNLTCTASGACDKDSVRATASKSSGKYYWEVKIDALHVGHTTGIGTSSAIITSEAGSGTHSYGYRYNGTKRHPEQPTGYGDSYTTNDIIGVALDLDNNKIWWSKNGVWQASGDPAAGTNPAFTGVSGTFFPMHTLWGTTGGDDVATARFHAGSFSYTPPSGFSPLETGPNLLDGKIVIENNAVDLLDGKTSIDTFAVNTFDGKADVKDSTLSLFNGKAEVIGWKADKLDGKARVVGWAGNLLDGKTDIANLSSKFFNGKVQIYLTTTDLLDGRIKLHKIATDFLDGKVIARFGSISNLLDGKASVQGWAADLLDGKIWVKELTKGKIDLPFLSVIGNTGAIGDITLPLFNISAEVSVGVDAQGKISLPGLKTVGFTGVRCNYDLPSLGISGVSTVGIAASGEIVLPIFNVEGQAFLDAVVHGTVGLPVLRINATSIHGSLCIGETVLPGIRVGATAKVGTICTGDVTLPCLIIEAEGGHIPIGEGNVILPLLQVYSNANVLVNPRDGCHVLRYSR